MMRHPQPADLALYAAGDLPLGPRIQAAVHLRTCDRCRELVEAFRADRNQLHATADDLPEGLEWDRLAAEMTANVHLGLAAGECVSPVARAGKSASHWNWNWNWRPAAIIAGLLLVITAAWWLNVPARDTAALKNVADKIFSRTPFGAPLEERGPTVEASETGIEFREGGRSMGMGFADAEPVTATVSLGLQSSASAQYVDDDTGMVTVTAVYVQ